MTNDEFWKSKIIHEHELSDKEWDSLLDSGSVNDDKHIFGKNVFYEKFDNLATRCEKCNLLVSINLSSKNDIIFYRRDSKLTCDEIIIKNIIE